MAGSDVVNEKPSNVLYSTVSWDDSATEDGRETGSLLALDEFIASPEARLISNDGTAISR